MTRNQSNIVAGATGMVVCASVFIASVLYQFGLLEGVASLATFVQVFLLSATVVDAMEDRQASSRIRALASVLMAILIVGWFGATYWTHGGDS
ncbi:MAG: hypothetical protein WBW53_02465 [Terriglobales bacterium]